MVKEKIIYINSYSFQLFVSTLPKSKHYKWVPSSNCETNPMLGSHIISYSFLKSIIRDSIREN